MRPMPRNVGWWAVAGVAVTAIVMATPGDDGATVETAAATASAGTSAPSSARPAQKPETHHVELERLSRTPPKADIGNAFNATSWYVPPPPPRFVPPPPPPPPTAPPLPFTYLGRYEDAPARLAILIKGERMYTVGEGEIIENTYRVERVAPGRVELTYLPLNEKQTLGTGEAP